MATFPIYQIYMELQDYEPKMWRRIQIMNDITVARLGYLIMVLYELRENYSYEIIKDEMEVYKKRHPECVRNPEKLKQLNRDFRVNRYGITSKKNMYMYKKEREDLQDATNVKLKDVFHIKGDELIFYYDPEINWKIKVVLEKEIIDKKLFAKDLPKVVEGKGYGIIETCSGTKDLIKFRDKLEKSNWKNHSDYQYYYTIGQKEDKLNFDRLKIDDMNFRIKTLPLVLQQKYEENLYPSDRTRKILKRKYTVYRKNTPIY